MKPPSRPLAIATRRSPLALVQARDVQARLAAQCGLSGDGVEAHFPILGLVSTGDMIQDRTLIEAGGKGLFTKEIDEAQLDGRAAFAVHSMKDVPTVLPDGLVVGALLEREDPHDMLIARNGETRLADLPAGVTVGTASLRRQAQLLHKRPDLTVVPLRGNVDTRLGKLSAGEIYATFLARAGLNRLGREEARRDPLDADEMLPAAAQGAVGVAIRAGDEEAAKHLIGLHHRDTELAVTAERAFLAELDGSCRTPIAAHVNKVSMDFIGEVLTPDGKQCWRKQIRFDMTTATPDSAREAGHRLGRAVRDAAGDGLAAALVGA
ncbi:porphobilinogen deaminase [Maricaulis sp. W15]|uniref:hydroxymethylbilane synthase n=1 Tax=Maricaulis sp. W15 TaxID=1772333 RepID=UPI000948CF67|nr:hydroxymethylbilane synthase [Maricaulis sp. W15]OLF80700.1 porphobilinogen deaminase [Maricaulis sp. W15]